MAKTRNRPLIGITGPRSGAIGPRLCVHIGLMLTGARPVHLKPGRVLPNRPLDGVVITGGHDVEPVLYKAESEVKGKYDQERDAFESEIIDKALAERMPILGICRGAQLLNVRLGGDLHQDITEQRKETSNRSTLLPLKTLCLQQNTYLRQLFGKDVVRINSLHRQSIDRLGKDLVISGYDLDRIVQAVEGSGPDFLLGVQWHPEFLLYMPCHRKLFYCLTKAAHAYKDKNGR